jgi:hypothetical protein
MQGKQNLRNEAYLLVCCNDEAEAQRRRWTFYETINKKIKHCPKGCQPPISLEIANGGLGNHH